MYWKSISLLFFIYSFSISSILGKDIFCENLNEDLIVISENQLAVVILLNEYRCSGCDNYLADFLKKIEYQNDEITFYAFVKYGDSPLEKFIIKNEIEDKYNLSFSEVCFDYRIEHKKDFVKFY